MKCSFYRSLPAEFKWNNIKKMLPEEARTVLPKTKNISYARGKFYSVSRSADASLVLKSSHLFMPIFNANYLDNEPADDLNAATFGASRQQEFFFPDASDISNTDAVKRAMADSMHYKKLIESIPNRYMVEQSVLLIQKKRFSGSYRIREILLQPFVPGINLGKMIPWSPFGKSLFKSKYKELLPIFGPQLRELIESDLVDRNFRNFIVTPEGNIVYIDYQPVFDHDQNHTNYNALNEILKNHGY